MTDNVDNIEEYRPRRRDSRVKMGIVGLGFVGKAVEYAFSTPGVDKMIVDPKHSSTSIDDLCGWNPMVTFVCLPSPSQDDGTVDASEIKKVVMKLINNSDSFIVIKSTITPDIVNDLASLDSRIAYNPEFLQENNAVANFVDAPFRLMGVSDQGASQYLEQLYGALSLCNPAPSIVCTPVEASIVKYAINSFLAMKVTFFNELKQLSDAYGGSYLQVTRAMLADQRIGYTHTRVPGLDGKEGYGGACFTKDVNAILKFAESIDVKLNVLEAAKKANDVTRSQYDLDEREKANNVDYGQAKEEQQDQDDGSAVGE